jgi:hypothetical protein
LIGSLKKLGFEIPKKKFSNNAIICLTLSPGVTNVHVELKMIHTGDINTNKTGEEYWVVDENMTDNKSINKEEFCEVFKINMDKFIISNSINCFFIRHGEAQHNTDKNELTRHTRDNTVLTITEDTKKAMKNAGIDLNEALTEYGNKINAVFVSDLIRTQQTAGYILSEVNSFNNNVPIFVLPCLHENKDGDGKGLFNIFARENQTDCRSDEGESTFMKKCSTINVGGIEKNINWSLYKLFYGGYYRDYIKNIDRYKCRDNHFLGLFFNNKIEIDNNTDVATITVYKKPSNESNNMYEKIENGIVEDDGWKIHPVNGGKKRRQTKKQRAMKSKKVRRMKKSNKKSKKVKRRSNKRKA